MSGLVKMNGLAKSEVELVPSPEEIMEEMHKTKVTMNVTTRTLKFFKEAARANKTTYQKLMRSLLDVYANRHAKE